MKIHQNKVRYTKDDKWRNIAIRLRITFYDSLSKIRTQNNVENVNNKI